MPRPAIPPVAVPASVPAAIAVSVTTVPAAVPAPVAAAMAAAPIAPEIAAPAILPRPALGKLPATELRRWDVELEGVVVPRDLPSLRPLVARAEEIAPPHLERTAADAAKRTDDA